MTKKPQPKGRPKKPAGEKLGQFSIRLTPDRKFMLDAYVKAHGLSLSAAVDKAIWNMLATETIDGEQLPDLVLEATRFLFAQFLDPNKSSTMEDLHKAHDAVIDVMGDENGRLVAFPPSILTEADKHFVATIKHLGVPFGLGKFGTIRAISDIAFSSGTSVPDTAHLCRFTLNEPSDRVLMHRVVTGADVKAGMDKAFAEVAKRSEEPAPSQGPKQRKKYPK